ncbi:MAG: hypothetical protein QXL67_05250, partial [Candidatus Bathyarchaeia archaeon]
GSYPHLSSLKKIGKVKKPLEIRLTLSLVTPPHPMPLERRNGIQSNQGHTPCHEDAWTQAS